MTDWEELRRELHTPFGEQAGAIDLGEVVRAGRRLRWRRRMIVAGTAAAVLAAGAAVPLLYRTTTASGPATPAAPGVTAASPSPVPSPLTPSPIATTEAGGALKPFGELARTGEDDGRVFFMVRHGDGRLGVATGWDTPGGLLVQAVASETPLPEAQQRGFHLDPHLGADVPLFGYFVGPAATISADIDGQRRTAVLWPWSEDPSVVIFFFPDVSSNGPAVAALDAYDVDGQPPTGAPPNPALTGGPPTPGLTGAPPNPVGSGD